jgi:hypothetical protein
MWIAVILNWNVRGIIKKYICLFIYVVFNDAVSSPDYISRQVINEQRTGKNVEGSGRDLLR